MTCKLQKEVELLKADLYQQRFNNAHNLSIDEKVAIELNRLKAENLELRDLVEEACENTWTTNFKDFREKAKKILEK